MDNEYASNKRATGNIHDRREDIIEAAAALFRERGFKGTSMQAIAERVGLPPGGLYYYIGSKEELLFEVSTRGIRTLLSALSEIKDLLVSPRERLYKAVYKHVIVLAQYRNYVSVFLHDRDALLPDHYEMYMNDRRRVEQIYKQIIQEGIEAGEFRVVNVKITTFLILGMCNWLTQWYHPEGELSAEEIARIAADAAQRMLLPTERDRPAK